MYVRRGQDILGVENNRKIRKKNVMEPNGGEGF